MRGLSQAQALHSPHGSAPQQLLPISSSREQMQLLGNALMQTTNTNNRGNFLLLFGDHLLKIPRLSRIFSLCFLVFGVIFTISVNIMGPCLYSFYFCSSCKLVPPVSGFYLAQTSPGWRMSFCILWSKPVATFYHGLLLSGSVPPQINFVFSIVVWPLLHRVVKSKKSR